MERLEHLSSHLTHEQRSWKLWRNSRFPAGDAAWARGDVYYLNEPLSASFPMQKPVSAVPETVRPLWVVVLAAG